MNMGKHVDQRGAHKALLGLDLFLGVTEVAGGIAILAGAISFPSEWLRGSPFSTYTAPGLVLLLVGVAALAAAGLVLRRHSWALAASLASGLLIMGFEIVEVAVVVRQAGPAGFSWLQPAYFALGLLLALLAAWLRANEHGRPPAQAGPIGAKA
jgi:hypothetical protein